jgi:DNA-directed RNA polymerase subunit RPC12/RpoP
MARRDLSCPVCNADLPLSGDELPGEEIFCAYCGAPCVIKGKPGVESEDVEVEADF